MFGLVLMAIQSVAICFRCSKYDETYRAIQFSAQILYMGLMISVSTTLFTRIYYTFKYSVFKLSKCKIYICIFMVISSIINGILLATIIILTYPKWDEGINLILNITPALISLLLYFGASIWLIYLFANKMYKLGKLIKTEQQNAEINQRKILLLYTTSKYISLLSIAILTTWITFIGVFSLGFTVEYWSDLARQVFLLQFNVDCLINILCLYLQFPFSQKYYEKYCKYFGDFWLCILKAKGNKNEGQTENQRELKYHIEVNNTGNDKIGIVESTPIRS